MSEFLRRFRIIQISSQGCRRVRALDFRDLPSRRASWQITRLRTSHLLAAYDINLHQHDAHVFNTGRFFQARLSASVCSLFILHLQHSFLSSREGEWGLTAFERAGEPTVAMGTKRSDPWHPIRYIRLARPYVGPRRRSPYVLSVVVGATRRILSLERCWPGPRI